MVSNDISAFGSRAILWLVPAVPVPYAGSLSASAFMVALVAIEGIAHSWFPWLLWLLWLFGRLGAVGANPASPDILVTIL